MALVIAIAAVSCGGGGEASPSTTGRAEDPPEVLVAEPVPVGGAPWGIAVDGDTVWVSDASRATLLRFDGAGGTLAAELPTGAPDPRDAGIAVVGGQLWVANLGGTVGVLDSSTGEPVARVATGAGEPAAVALDDRWAWVPTHGPGGGLARLDRARPDAGPVTVALPESGFAVAVDGNVVWVAGLDGRVFAVDADRAELVRTIEVGGAPRGVVVAGGDVWVSLRDDRAVVRLDATTGEEVARIATGGQPWPIAAGGGFVWTATLEGRLLRLDPAEDRVTAEANVGPNPRSIAVGAGAVWVASQSGTVTRADAGS